VTARTPAAVLLALVAALLPGGAARAESYEVSAFLEPNEGITEGQTVRLVLQAQGQGRPALEAPSLEGLQNLHIVGRPGSAFSSAWRLGRHSTTTQLLYTLLVEGPGPGEVPELALVVDGTAYRTEPIHFVAAAAPTVPSRPADPGSRDPAGADDRADVFLRAQVGSEEAWVGQAVPLSLLLYANEDFERPDFVSQPSLDGFWVEELGVDASGERFQALVDGRRYDVYPLARRMLVPQAAGVIEIEPFVMQIPVRARRSEILPMRRMQWVVRKTEPISLEVRPLPEAGRPADFSGAVGRFALRAAVDREEARASDAVALAVTVEGEGFLRSVEPPSIDALPDLELFEPRITSASRNVQGRFVSRKTWEWILVPLVPGDLALPEVRFSYFDTAAGEYRTLGESLPRLSVRPADRDSGAAAARGDIRLQRRDLAFIKPLQGVLRQESPRAHRRAGFFLALALPLAWGPLLVLAGRHRARMRRDLGLARSRHARGRAQKRLRGAERRLADRDASAFHEEIARALVGYVADRFDRSPAGLTYDVTDGLLASRGLDAEARREFRDCVEACDFARFVPASVTGERRAELLARAVKLIDGMERSW
jgi:hypothetical protein